MTWLDLMIIVGAFSNLVPDCLDDNDDNVFLLLSFEDDVLWSCDDDKKWKEQSLSWALDPVPYQALVSQVFVPPLQRNTEWVW